MRKNKIIIMNIQLQHSPLQHQPQPQLKVQVMLCIEDDTWG